MIDFLKKYDIKEETINKMYEIQSDSYLFDLNSNERECCKIINYLRFIGIKNIDDLLLYECELFFKNKNNIEFAFSKYNIKVLVEMINDDYNQIEVIFDDL